MTSDQHGQRRVEQPREHDHQRQRRDHQEPVLERVEDAVGPAAEVAAGEADRRAEHGRDQRRREADDDRDPGADEELREDVGAALGRAEDVAPARRGEHVEARARSGRTGRSALPKIARKIEQAEDTECRTGRARCRTAARGGESRDRPAGGGAAAATSRVLIAPAPAGRGRSRGSRRAGWRRSPRREKTRNVPCSTGKSLSLIALKVSSPRPGQEKIVSIVIAPPATAPNWIADSVTSGSSAFGTAWLRTTRCQGSPVARLTVMKSSVSTSTIDERMIRKYWPSSISVIAVAGRIRWSSDVERLGRTSSRTRPRASSAGRPGRSVSRPRRRGSG